MLPTPDSPLRRVLVAAGMLLAAALVVVLVASVHGGDSAESTTAEPDATFWPGEVLRSDAGDRLILSPGSLIASSGSGRDAQLVSIANDGERRVLSRWSSASPSAPWRRDAETVLARNVAPTRVAVAPDGRDVYVHDASASIVHYSVQPDGRMLERERVPAPARAYDFEVLPAGRGLVLTDGWLHHFPLDERGAIREPSTIKLAKGSVASSIAVPTEPAARHFYVVLRHADAIAQFELDAEGSVRRAPVMLAKTGNAPFEMSLSADGTAAYVVNAGHGTVSTYARDTETGRLRVQGRPVRAGRWPRHIVALDRYVFVADFSDRRTAAFRVQSDRSLTRDRASDGLPLRRPQELVAVPAS